MNQPYTSARSRRTNTGFQPFLGAARLGNVLDTRHANQARVASAARNLPRPVRLPSQSRGSGLRPRGRGPSNRPPALVPPPSLQSSINGCQYVDVEGDRTMVRITVKVYPVHEHSVSSANLIPCSMCLIPMLRRSPHSYCIDLSKHRSMTGFESVTF